jgi:hypothetical protein
MAKWMDITICGLNVAITCELKRLKKTGTESSEQQQSKEPAYGLDEKVQSIKGRIEEFNSQTHGIFTQTSQARLQSGFYDQRRVQPRVQEETNKNSNAETLKRKLKKI